MNKVEFKTIIHNGIIEIPNNNPEIKDKEVNVIIQWEEKPVAKKKSKVKPVREPESNGNLEEVFGIWKGKNISLDKIRGQQWERKTK